MLVFNFCGKIYCIFKNNPVTKIKVVSVSNLSFKQTQAFICVVH